MTTEPQAHDAMVILRLTTYLRARRDEFLQNPPSHVIAKGERLARIDELLRLEQAFGLDVFTAAGFRDRR